MGKTKPKYENQGLRAALAGGRCTTTPLKESETEEKGDDDEGRAKDKAHVEGALAPLGPQPAGVGELRVRVTRPAAAAAGPVGRGASAVGREGVEFNREKGRYFGTDWEPDKSAIRGDCSDQAKSRGSSGPEGRHSFPEAWIDPWDQQASVKVWGGDDDV